MEKICLSIPMQPGSERSGPVSSFSSKRELFRRRIAVLLAARCAEERKLGYLGVA